MDREGDFFELLEEQRHGGRAEILVRAQHDRRLERKGAKLFATLAGGSADERIEVEVAGLRYCLELFSEQYGPSFSALLGALRDLQHRPGVPSDCDSTIRLLHSDERPNDANSQRLLATLSDRHRDATEPFLAYWKGDFGMFRVEVDWCGYLMLDEERISSIRG